MSVWFASIAVGVGLVCWHCCGCQSGLLASLWVSFNDGIFVQAYFITYYYYYFSFILFSCGFASILSSDWGGFVCAQFTVSQFKARISGSIVSVMSVGHVCSVIQHLIIGCVLFLCLSTVSWTLLHLCYCELCYHVPCVVLRVCAYTHICGSFCFLTAAVFCACTVMSFIISVCGCSISLILPWSSTLC